MKKQSFRTYNPILLRKIIPTLTICNFIRRMESPLKESTTPGGSSKEESTIAFHNASGHTVLGSPNICDKDESERHETPCKLKFKRKYYIGTINVNSLIRVGKQKELEKLLEKNQIQILAVQETRFLDKNVVDTEHYRLCLLYTSRCV